MEAQMDINETPVETTEAVVETTAEVAKKKRSPGVRTSVQRNGVQHHVHKVEEELISQYMKTFTVSHNVISLIANDRERGSKPTLYYFHFPWWMDRHEEVMAAMRALPIGQTQNGAVAIWADSSHVGAVVDLMRSWGIDPSRITKQMTIDYSSRYCEVSGNTFVPVEYPSPAVRKRKVDELNEADEDDIAAGVDDPLVLAAAVGEFDESVRRRAMKDPMSFYRTPGERVSVERVSPNITDSEFRALTRPTTEDLFVGYFGDPSGLFKDGPQCRIPYMNWHVDIFEETKNTRKNIVEARHPTAIRTHIENSLSQEARVVEFFASDLDALMSNFQIVSPFAPGIYYVPQGCKYHATYDLRSLLSGALNGKYTKNQLKQMADLVSKYLNPNTTAKGKATAEQKMLKILTKKQDGTLQEFVDTIEQWDSFVRFLGVERTDLDKIQFYPALLIALTVTRTQGSTIRESKKTAAATSSSASSNGQTTRRGFNRPQHFSDELAEFLGENDIPRTEVNKKISQYIKENGLKCTEPGKTRKFIPDAKLAALLGTSEPVDYFSDLPRLMNVHFPPSKKRMLEHASKAESSQATAIEA